MAHTLIQVGNSKALIIPARLLKKRGYDSATEFDILETPDGFRIVRKAPVLEALAFPRVERPALSARVKGLRGLVSFTPEELEEDERLKYILSR